MIPQPKGIVLAGSMESADNGIIFVALRRQDAIIRGSDSIVEGSGQAQIGRG